MADLLISSPLSCGPFLRCQLQSIRRSVSRSVLQSLSSLVLSRLDYGNVYGQVSSTVSSPDNGIVDETRLTQLPARITSLFGNKSGYREPIVSAQPVAYPANPVMTAVITAAPVILIRRIRSSQGRPVTELNREDSGSILRRRALTDNLSNLRIEADTRSTWNRRHIGSRLQTKGLQWRPMWGGSQFDWH